MYWFREMKSGYSQGPSIPGDCSDVYIDLLDSSLAFRDLPEITMIQIYLTGG